MGTRSYLVRQAGEIQVEPLHPFVERADQKVVAPRVYRHGRDPLDSSHQLLAQLLLDEIVDANMALCRHEQVRSDWVEKDTLDETFSLGEGDLGKTCRRKK